MKRNFAEWLLTFTDSIADYKYYIDFETIYKKAEKYKIELNIMNSLIGSQNIEKDFEELIIKYPEIIKCIPTLLAVRQYEILVLDHDGNKFDYNFKKMNYSVEQYKIFMRETGFEFGRFDFLRKEKTLYFLELNPNGQWAWLDLEYKNGIFECIANEIKRVYKR